MDINCYQIICQGVGAFKKILNLNPSVTKKNHGKTFV